MGIFDRKKINKFPNGKIEELFYVNISGNKNGEYTRYHENGTVFQKAFFKNDIQERVSQTFDLKGNLIRERNFINGLTQGPIKEYYKDGLIKLIIEDISHVRSSNTKHSFYNERGKLTCEAFTRKVYFNEASSLTSSLTYNLQRHEIGDKILPFSKWLTYNENGNVVCEIDFEILKPNAYKRNWKGVNNTVEFSNCACEIRNYDSNGLLVEREQKSLDSINEDFFSDDLSSIKFRSEHDNSESFDPIKFIVFTDFVISRFSNATSKELRNKFKIIKKPKNWIKGFDILYDRPSDVEQDPPFNIPLYYESGEESYSSPSIHSYTKSHIQLYTLSEEDALKLINELMIFNGGVFSFKADVKSEVYSDMEVVFQNHIIRIYKSYPHETTMPIKDFDVPVKIIFIGIDLLPPKNLARYNSDSLRGIHPESVFVNNFLVGLNKPILCNADGGVTDGRLFVMADDRSDIILSAYEDNPDIDLFKNIIKSFSKSNSILELKNTDIIRMADSFDFINESKTGKLGSYQPIMNLKKSDCVLSFIIIGKIMVSFLKNHGFYHIRIDKKSETEWKNLKFLKKDKLEFYISKTQKEILDSDFNTEASKLHKLFTEQINGINEQDYVKKFNLSDEVDFPYWYDNIKKRANSGLSQLEGKMNDNKIAEYIYGHANEYENRLVDEEYEFKEMFIKFRIIGFGECYKLLVELDKNLNLLKNKFAINSYPSEDKIFNELAHGKASLYGAIKYALSIGINKIDIKKYYSDFIDDNNLIKGVDPFENLRNKLNLDSKSNDEDKNDKFSESEMNVILDKIRSSIEDESKKIELVKKINKEKDIIKQEKMFLAELKKDPNNHFILNSLAYNQYEQKKYKKGIGFVKKAMKISDGNYLLDTLGLGYFYLKEFSKSLEMFDACIKKDIENKKEIGEHYFNRANTYLEMGRLNESKNDYNKCIEIKDGFEVSAKLAIDKINKNPLNGKF
jgi:hypothetical protein